MQCWRVQGSPAWSGHPEQDERQPPDQPSCAPGESRPAARRSPFRVQPSSKHVYTRVAGSSTCPRQASCCKMQGPQAGAGSSRPQHAACKHGSHVSLVAPQKQMHLPVLCSSSIAAIPFSARHQLPAQLQHTVMCASVCVTVSSASQAAHATQLCHRVWPAHRGCRG